MPEAPRLLSKAQARSPSHHMASQLREEQTDHQEKPGHPFCLRKERKGYLQVERPGAYLQY